VRISCRFPRSGGAGRGTLSVGESVAVDGTCLTVTRAGKGWFETLAAPETVRRTIIGCYRLTRPVNLERAMLASGRLGGHFVQGHIDGRARLRSVRREGDSRVCRLAPPRGLAPLIVEKGPVALDGVSLTVSAVGRGWFEVMLVPHTLRATTMSQREPGDELNIETDLIAKYVRSLLGARSVS